MSNAVFQVAHCTGEADAAVDRALAEIDRQRANLTRAIATLDDPEASAPLVGELRSLTERRRQLEAERENFLAAARTKDFREGVAAFFERREPEFGK